jgi:hypothetical protein
MTDHQTRDGIGGDYREHRRGAYGQVRRGSRRRVIERPSAVPRERGSNADKRNEYSKQNFQRTLQRYETEQL